MIEPDVGPRPAEPQDLRQADVELVDAVAVHRARLDQVHRDVGGARSTAGVRAAG